MSQADKIEKYLTSVIGRTITAPQARHFFGVQNLRARICEIGKKRGIRFRKYEYTTSSGNKGIKYRLIRDIDAILLRRSGMTYQQIADALNINNIGTVWQMCNRDRYNENQRNRYRA